MLTVVKNQIKVSVLSIKYALIKEMLNKTSFITNVIFMILNNGCMIIQWFVLFNLKENIGGLTLKEVILLWGIASGIYGVTHFFFKNAYNLSDIIAEGKLDAILVQPKNVLLSVITTDVSTPALGDILYSYVMLFIYGFSIKNFILFTIFIILGGIVNTAVSIILGSLSFWFTRSDLIAETGNSIMVNFSTYPDGIFKGIVKWLIYYIIPLEISVYLPIKTLISFNINYFIISIIGTSLLVILSAFIFYKGLKRYSSSNLMIARI